MIKRTEKMTAGYIHSYERGGIEGLTLGHSPGKRRRLTDQFTDATKRPVDVDIEAKYKRKVPTYGRHEGAKLFGVLNNETGHVLYRDGERYDTPALLQFLDAVRKSYPKGKNVMTLDNSRIHHAEQVQAHLQKHTRLQFVFLPKYSPELNLVEGLWKCLKSEVVHNGFYKKFYHIRINVAAFMKRVNDNPVEVIDRLCIAM